MMIGLHKFLRPVHRWVGLTVGMVLVVMAITGAGLVFRERLELSLDHDLLSVPTCAPRVPLDTLTSNAVRVYPQGKLDYIRLIAGEADSARMPAAMIRFTDRMFVYLNPCTGEVLGLRSGNGGVFGVLECVHRMLFLPGSHLVTGTSVLIFVFVLVLGGFVLWWPGTWRSARRALALRAPRAGEPARHIRLHKAIGLYAALIVLISALTGLPQAFDWYRDGVYLLMGSPPPGPMPISREIGMSGPRMPMEIIWQKVRTLVPEPVEARFRYPVRTDDAVEIYVADRSAPHSLARSLIVLDAYTGETLKYIPYAASSPGYKLYYWMLAMHLGYVGGWVGQALLLFGALCIPLLGYTGIRSWLRRGERDPSRLPRQVRVVRKTIEAAHICVFELADPGGAELPAFAAGAHIDVQTREGLVRQYSLCNDPRETHRYLIGVLRTTDSRGGSRAMHEEVGEGDLIRIGEPRNHFPLAHAAEHSLLLAAGIGITPILCMAERLANTGGDFRLHYWARSREHAAFVERIERSAFANRTKFHFSQGSPGQRAALDDVLAQPAAGMHLYVCGPTRFMDAALTEARRAGWREENLHREYFSADVRQSANDTEFVVKLASSGKSYTVGKQASVLDVLAANGILLPRSCEQGVCGTCLTVVLDGEPDHRDHVLTDEERKRNDRFAPCCSRARSASLTLDL